MKESKESYPNPKRIDKCLQKYPPLSFRFQMHFPNFLLHWKAIYLLHDDDVKATNYGCPKNSHHPQRDYKSEISQFQEYPRIPLFYICA